MASASELRALLEQTSVPAPLTEEFLAETNALWTIAEAPEVVAGEVVLCHPPLDAQEIRAVVMATDQPGRWRITIVTHDRPGLLAATAGVLARERLAVTQAAVTVLCDSRLALQRITVEEAGQPLDGIWEGLAGQLRGVLGAGRSVTVPWQPRQPVTIACHPQGTGRVVVQVTAPDTTGLLWAIARALTGGGANIEAARLASEDGMANDVFICEGPVDSFGLAEALSPGDVTEGTTSLGRFLTGPLSLSRSGLRWGADLLARLGESEHPSP